MVQQVPPPKRKPRHDEWTREKMAGFLRELAATQSVAAAARSVGMSRTSAYNLRNRCAGTPFALAWEVAFAAPSGALPGRRERDSDHAASPRHPVAFPPSAL